MVDQYSNKIEDLEIRLMHQEASIDELTKSVVMMQKDVSRLSEHVSSLEEIIKQMRLSQIAPQSEETPPPHY